MKKTNFLFSCIFIYLIFLAYPSYAQTSTNNLIGKWLFADILGEGVCVLEFSSSTEMRIITLDPRNYDNIIDVMEIGNYSYIVDIKSTGYYRIRNNMLFVNNQSWMIFEFQNQNTIKLLPSSDQSLYDPNLSYIGRRINPNTVSSLSGVFYLANDIDAIQSIEFVNDRFLNIKFSTIGFSGVPYAINGNYLHIYTDSGDVITFEIIDNIILRCIAKTSGFWGCILFKDDYL
jgi:hypothetical protein